MFKIKVGSRIIPPFSIPFSLSLKQIKKINWNIFSPFKHKVKNENITIMIDTFQDKFRNCFFSDIIWTYGVIVDTWYVYLVNLFCCFLGNPWVPSRDTVTYPAMSILSITVAPTAIPASSPTCISITIIIN